MSEYIKNTDFQGQDYRRETIEYNSDNPLDIKSIFDDIENLKMNILNLLNESKTIQSGVICPKCGAENKYVTNSRTIKGLKTRRRRCKECGENWTTIEVMK